MKKRILGAILLAVFVVLLTDGFAHAGIWNSFIYSYDDWTITNLGTLPEGYQTVVYQGAINNCGQAVGYVEGINFQSAFLWTDGVMTDLGALTGSTSSIAKGINDNGQVVGIADHNAFLYSDGVITMLGSQQGWFRSTAVDINNNGQVVGNAQGYGGFIYSGGVMTQLDVPESHGFVPQSINNNGQVVGYANLLSGPTTAFLYSDGEMISLAQPGWTMSHATSINDSGQVVGTYWNGSGDGFRAFLYSDGEMIDLGRLFGESTYANDINDEGQVVGMSKDLNNQYHPYLWSGGVMVDLGIHPQSHYTEAMGINDNGQILIRAQLPGDAPVIPSPPSVPLPPTVILFGTGLLNLAIWRRFRKG